MTASGPMVKQSVDNLAAFGGQPLFLVPLHVGRPNLPPFQAVEARLRGVFERGWLTNHGPEVIAFEREIAALAGVKHAIAVCNATIGLSVAARALGMTGEVIVPSFTFVATVHALAWQGIDPVFCDIDPVTHGLDPHQIERLITPRTTGIIPVHVWGRPCDVESIETIARRHGLSVVYDAAHALGCSWRGRPIGGQGDASVFSFHATKFVNAFEGGAIATDDDGLAERVRLMINFGFADYDHVVSIGTNGKMSEASAAMGLASLDRLDDVMAWNESLYRKYRQELEGIPGIALFEHCETERSNFQYVVVEVSGEEIGLRRDVLLEVLWRENVLARRYFYPGVHRMEPYRTQQPAVGSRLPQTERLGDRVMVLPSGTSVTPSDAEAVCRLIRFCAEHGAEIAGRLPQDKLLIARDLR